MKTSILCSLCFLLFNLLVGCASRPLPTESKIKLGPLELALPKNFKGDEMNFGYGAGTNRITLVLKGFTLTNDPMVLSAEAAGYVSMINAMSGMFNSALAAGMSGAAKSGGLPAAADGRADFHVRPDAGLVVPSTIQLPLVWTPTIQTNTVTNLSPVTIRPP